MFRQGAENSRHLIADLTEICYIHNGTWWRPNGGRPFPGSKVVKESRIGYAYGLNYPPDWGEHTVSLRPGDKNVFQPNMTIHVMPGIWLDKFGFECSEPIYVTGDGCETFVPFERKLFVK